MTSIRSRSGPGMVSEPVGGGDEHDLRQIEGHVQVVVAELAVLLRVEHFQQGRGRVAAEILAELVDLVEHEDRVARFRPGAGLQDAPRHGADVGAAVTADLGLVTHAAEGRSG